MKKVVLHGLVWLVIYVIYTIMLSIHNDPYAIMLFNLLNVLLYMSAYYVLRYIQIPYLYESGKKGWFFISLILSATALYILFRLGLYAMHGFRGIDSRIRYDVMADYLVKIIRFYSPAMVLLALESHFKGRQKQARIRELEKENLVNELKYLKAQINPQFLINTLNNLYTNVLNDTSSAPDMIMRLSSILDYGLYKSQQSTVSLEEEINAIKNFVHLEQLRSGTLDSKLHVEGDMDVHVSPLILLSVVEHAFKTSISSKSEKPKVNIHIFESEGKIHCNIKFSKLDEDESFIDKKDANERSGLSGIKRQLELVYPDQYQFDVMHIDAETNHILLTLNAVYE